jgi:hypothetical protein
MSRFAVSGIAVVMSIATGASGLTFTPTTDHRQTYVTTDIMDGSFTDSDQEFPVPSFSDFSSDISADEEYDGYFADAFASQFSRLGSMYIEGSGGASAQIGVTFDNWVDDSADSLVNQVPMESNQASAFGQSLLEILFSIDMDAQYDLSGFIGAGVDEVEGGIPYASEQSVSVVLYDVVNDVALVDESVTDGDQSLSNAGQIGPGSYRFTINAMADVYTVAGVEEMDSNGITPVPQRAIYSTSAGFKGVNLTLSGRDQPIPEPVTTTLAAMGMGALVLRTSRRRRA